MLVPWTSRGSSVRTPFDLSQGLTEFRKGFLDEELATTIFLRSHRQLLRDTPNGISWWVPKELGGLGLIPLSGVDVTFRQRELANYLYEGGKTGKVIPPPNPLDSDLPEYVKACLQKFKSKKFLMTREDSLSNCVWDKIPEDYRPVFWLDPDIDLEEIRYVDKDGRRLTNRKLYDNWFKRAWKRSAKKGAPSSELLFSLPPLEWKSPDNLDTFLYSAGSCPKGLYRQITASRETIRLMKLNSIDTDEVRLESFS